MNGIILDDNMSNLTSASHEASISSSHRNENGNQLPPAKKKRNLPGNPDPDAEVVALSPRTLMATNRFICEICKKGFQRDQNLQLHRRGHNLPWKLKQRTNKEVKKNVYVCPEPTCVHHEAARALGDLTGIKKHFSRKHGEKKWKCEKCSKRYAVQSDWKAHSRICGKKEYRCDCETLFSRRDSFITHRAFCDALAEESARAKITPNPLLSSQPGPSSTSHFNLQSPLLHNPANLQAFPLMKRKQNHQQSFNPKPDLPPWLAPQASPGPPWLHHSFIHHENPNPSPSPSFPSFQPTVSPHMSATALLQKAAQMGSGFSSSPLAPSAAGSGLFSREELNLASFGNKAVVTSGCMELVGATDQVGSGAPSLLHNMVSSLPPGSGFEGSISLEEALNGMLNPKMDSNFRETITKPAIEANFSICNEGGGGGGGGSRGGNDGLTRDFLGLRAFSHWGFQNMSGLDQINSSPSYDRQNQN